MKKILTFLFAAVFASAASAQSESVKFGIDAYPWNYTAELSSADVIYTSQWGEYNIINAGNAISPADYKGCHVEYQGFPETVQVTDETSSYVQLKIGDGKQYMPFDANGSELTINFNDDIMALESIEAINVQGQAAGPRIFVKNFYLIKTDGTEERVNKFANSGWGYTCYAASADLTFSGQYGGLSIVEAESGEDVTFKSNSGDTPYKYVIEYEEEAANGFMVELDEGDKAGFQWNGVPAGTKTSEIEISDATCGAYLESGFENRDMTSLWLKSNLEDGYPFDLQVKRIYRVSLAAGLRGNVTNDGEVNLADLMTKIDHLLGVETEVFVEANGNLNANDEVDLADVFLLVDILLTQE